MPFKTNLQLRTLAAGLFDTNVSAHGPAADTNALNEIRFL